MAIPKLPGFTLTAQIHLFTKSNYFIKVEDLKVKVILKMVK